PAEELVSEVEGNDVGLRVELDIGGGGGSARHSSGAPSRAAWRGGGGGQSPRGFHGTPSRGGGGWRAGSGGGGVHGTPSGGGVFTMGEARASGVSAHIQGGAFVTHTFGLLLDVGLGGGTIDPCCSGPLAPSGTAARHSVGLEAELIPLGLGPVHLGVFAGGGL